MRGSSSSLGFVFVFCLFHLILIEPTEGISRDAFLPYGIEYADSKLAASDDSFARIQLRYAFDFAGRKYSYIFVNVNGVLSFGQGVPDYTPACATLSANPMVDAFWADIDLTHGGNTFYRQTLDRTDLRQASLALRESTFQLDGFSAQWVFIATYEDCPFFGQLTTCGLTDPLYRNTFQASLISDGIISLVLLYYEKLSWTTGTASGGNCLGLEGQPAQVGINWGYDAADKPIQLPGSCTSEVLTIVDGRNFGSNSGQYIFRVNSVSDILACVPPGEKVQVKPGFVSFFGHELLTITGFCNTDNTISPDDITCEFAIKIEARRIVVPGQLGYSAIQCVVPYIGVYGTIPITLAFRRAGVFEKYTGVIYTVDPRRFFDISLRGVIGTPYWAGDMDWAPLQLGNRVESVVLILVENQEGIWVERYIVLDQTINNGSYNGYLAFDSGEGRPIPSIALFRLHAWPVTLGELESVQNFKNSVFSNLKYLGSTDPDTSVELCEDWYDNDRGPPADFIPCPPTLEKAVSDLRFQSENLDSHTMLEYYPGAQYSFRQLVPYKSGNGQQCCYDENGNMIAVGSVDMASPDSPHGLYDHFVKDQLPYLQCCKYPDDEEESCRLYFEKRPSDLGVSYIAPGICATIGDPHFISWDGLDFTFNGVGEFWMIKSTNFQMQGRMEIYRLENGTEMPASIFTSFVMTNENHTIQLSAFFDGFDIYIDGELTKLENNEDLFPILMISDSEVSLTLESRTRVVISWGIGISFLFTTADDNRAINVIASVDRALFGTFVEGGLYGNFDGESSNDLKNANGTVLDPNSSPEVIHYEFGLTWAIGSAEESLFVYPFERDFSMYQNPEFLPTFKFPDISKFPPKVIQMCENNLHCLFDYGATGSISLANATKNIEIEFAQMAQALNRIVEMCPALIAPEHGYFKVNNTFLGSIATFGCDKNYHLIGKPQLKCIKKGHSEIIWNGHPPRCKLCKKLNMDHENDDHDLNNCKD